MIRLIYISSNHGDWCGIYLDDRLYTEGHSIPVWEWLEIIKTLLIDTTEQYEVDGDWVGWRGSFPQTFSEIPKDMFV